MTKMRSARRSVESRCAIARTVRPLISRSSASWMLRSDPGSVEYYLDMLPEDRKDAIGVVRHAILENLPDGFEETFQHGMIAYVIPLSAYPVTYNKLPLLYAALASHKNYMSVYLMNIYGNLENEGWFLERYKASGKKLDMGKSCVRFRGLKVLPVDLIGEAIARTTMAGYIQIYEDSRKKA